MTEKCCKLYQLSYAPNIITIMFNKYYDKKIMDFPQNITFPGVDDVLLRYNAVAQIEHSGGMNGGHYWAKCLRKGPSNTTNEIIVDSAPDISYYTLNDSSVSIGNIHSTRETYIVLYHLL